MAVTTNLTSAGTMFIEFYSQKFLPWLDKGLSALVVLIAGMVILWIIIGISKRAIRKIKADKTIKKFLFKLTKTSLWVLLLLIVLTVAGVNIGPILAGLGIAGFIVGFALKDTLSNFASGFMIIFYRPFVIGEHVEVAGVKAVVKTVGSSACTFISEDNKLIIIPNSKIWGGVIKNFDRLKK